MSYYYNSNGQLVQSLQVLPPYPLDPQGQSPVIDPNQYAMSAVDPGQATQVGLEPSNHSPDQYGPRRSSRLRNRTEAVAPYNKKRKSTTRKVVEGVLIGVAGTVVLSEIERRRNRKTPPPSGITGTPSTTATPTTPGGGGSGVSINELVEGGLGAGAIGLALYEKNKIGKENGSAE